MLTNTLLTVLLSHARIGPTPRVGKYDVGLSCKGDFNVPGQSLESLAVGLHDGDRDVTQFARLDISDHARLALMTAADDPASRTVFQVSRQLVFRHPLLPAIKKPLSAERADVQLEVHLEQA